MTPVYLLIEEVNRELLSRQLIGREACNLGHPVVIGQQWWIADNLHNLKPGIVLFKGNNRYQAQFMGQAKRAGHRTASLDEESFVSSSDLEIAAQYHPMVAENCDLILVQGEFQRGVVKSRLPAARDRISLVGNPRGDILSRRAFLSHDPVVEQYRDAHGDYILVNTNFTKINPRHGDTYSFFELCRRAGVLDVPKYHPLDWFLDGCKWERENLQALVVLIQACRERFGGVRIVIRPHPSERSEVWHKQFENVEGIDVIGEGDHLAWISGARLLLHSGCSTGLEAFLLGSPAISLTPGDKWWNTGVLSNLVNFLAESPAEALGIAERLLSDKEAFGTERVRQEANLEHYLIGFGPEGAAARIANALGALSSTRPWPKIERGRHKVLGRGTSARMARKAHVDLQEFNRRFDLINTTIGKTMDVGCREIGPSVFQLSDQDRKFVDLI
jgi:surface carbohydrate biosynthesis protein